MIHLLQFNTNLQVLPGFCRINIALMHIWLNLVMLFAQLCFSSVVTVNDYLAQRDAEWMGRVHRFLGLSVGLIQV